MTLRTTFLSIDMYLNTNRNHKAFKLFHRKICVAFRLRFCKIIILKQSSPGKVSGLAEEL